MKLYIVELVGWDTYERFGLFKKKENAVKCLNRMVELKNEQEIKMVEELYADGCKCEPDFFVYDEATNTYDNGLDNIYISEIETDDKDYE